MRTISTIALLLSFVLTGQELQSPAKQDGGGERRPRWALMLEGAPLVEMVANREGLATASLSSAGHKLFQQQDLVRSEVKKRGLRVTGATTTLVNAVYVQATQEEAAALGALPGVNRVVRLKAFKRHDARASDLVNAAQAWNTVGGVERAGEGTRIGILDTGIDHTHPAFDDPSLRPPAGFPKCRGGDCAYTNSKVIVARSYVEISAAPAVPLDSRPDDYSPRDRVGHGTAAATVAAGRRVRGPASDVVGVAPKAFLGNYKVFGSPGVNDSIFGDSIALALEDAFNDGMDVVSLSLGFSADFPWNANFCGSTRNRPCDPDAQAAENAVRLGMVVVVSAGNDGDTGVLAPALGSINSPGTAPSVITVGATTNSHVFFSTLRTLGAGVPAELQQIRMQLSNGIKPAAPLTAPIRDVARLANDGKACTPLGDGTLAGAIALIQRGDCEFLTKITNAQRAGAVAVVIYQRDGSDLLFPISDVAEGGIPIVMIGNTRGKQLKDFIGARSDVQVTLDPALVEIDASGRGEFDTVAYFSSAGPAIGTFGIKPELVAPGTDMYMGTQNYDPNGDLYSPDRYFAAQGTSFSAPLVAGAVALVKQVNPRATPAQLKSAVVNTANPNVEDVDGSNQLFRARVVTVGAGKLNAADAVRSKVAAEPAALSLGAMRSGDRLPSTGLRLSNFGTAQVSLTLTAEPRDTDSRARIAFSQTNVTLAPGASSNITVRLDGAVPVPGNYEGVIRIAGGPVPLRVPYLYAVGDNTPYNAFPLAGNGFIRTPGSGAFYFNFKVVDRYGVPVVGAPVTFRVESGGGRIADRTADTDDTGIAEAIEVYTGATTGFQSFSGSVNNYNNLVVYFDGRNRLRPTIRNGGVANAASGQLGPGAAPGSYISIFGAGLSESLRVFNTPYLPLSLAGVSVSFDVPARGTSYPGRLHFVSDGQINVQVPWELQGLTSCQIKVSIGNNSSALYDLSLADTSPGLFEYSDAGRLTVAALDEAFRVVGSNNPVERGKVLQIYGTGLGPVNDPQISGEAATGISATRANAEVTVGGQSAQVLYSGLAPGAAGLYQVNVVVPSGAPTGIQPVVLRIGGATAKTVNTVVR